MIRTNRFIAIATGLVLAVKLPLFPTPEQQTPQEQAQKAADRMTERMQSELHLTADQIPKVREINLATMRSLQELLSKYQQDPSLNKKEMVREALAAVKAGETQLQQVLTPEQWQAHLAGKVASAAEMQTQMMHVQLDLTDEQIPRVGEINLAAAQKMRNALGSAEEFEKKSRWNKMTALRKLRGIFKERDQALQPVLTSVQWKIYQAHQEQMKEMMQKKIHER